MDVSKLLLICTFLACAGLSTQTSPEVNLTIYYETYCGPSRQMIEDILIPAYAKLGDILKLNLVSYGGAMYMIHSNGSIEFKCSHGHYECFVNRIHACAINLSPPQAQLLKFIECDLRKSMFNTNDELLEFAKECADDSNLPYDDIEQCVNGSLGDEVLLSFADEQAKAIPNPYYSPDFRFFDIFESNQDIFTVEAFIQHTCSFIEGEKPTVCQKNIKL
ncbi:GILT-like protein 1 [Diabrotica virgifera virgifera]|uniref:GILT-like protein 1 n=1 Tax=Diabrotica virgifera virgifera TaxID=50390 RepID=A0A6P7GER2_DIAVI|nr:GILT-like protein 1 [Diabrotica virgifera virgifera]